MAMITQFADAVEVEIGSVESNNASLRRRKHWGSTQQKYLSVQDLSMLWQFKSTRYDVSLIYGQQIPEVPEDSASDSEKIKAVEVGHAGPT